MDMSTCVAQQGDFLVKYDKVNKVIAGQWNNNKVVSFISTIIEFDLVDVRQPCRRDILDLTILKPLKLYQQSMGGVDRGD